METDSEQSSKGFLEVRPFELGFKERRILIGFPYEGTRYQPEG